MTEGTKRLEENLKGSLVDMIKDCQDQVFQSYQSKFRAHGSATGSPNGMPEIDPRSRLSSSTHLTAFFQQPPPQDVEYIAPDVLNVQQQNAVQATRLQGQYSDSGYNSMFNSLPSAQLQNTVPTHGLQSQHSDSGYNSMFNSRFFAETQDHNTGSHSYWCYNCNNNSHNCLCHRAVDFSTRGSAIPRNAEGFVALVSHPRNENMSPLNDASDLAPAMGMLENYSSNPKIIDNVHLEHAQEGLGHDMSVWRPNETYPEFPDWM